ncbi:unnamed protein product [Amaranthus hypochondriacus]
MVRIGTIAGMSLGAFLFWESMDKVHVWIALHQDEKREREEKEKEVRRMRDELVRQATERNSIA